MVDAPVPDWRLLAPHRPLGPGESAYVVRPTGGGDAIATWIAAGGSTVLVGGPTGIGKSTELARAAQALSATRVACLVQVDRMANMHRLTADEFLRLIAQRLVAVARDELQLPISGDLAAAVHPAGPSGNPRETILRMSSASLAGAALEEVSRLALQGRIALLIDGLEKLPAGPEARDIVQLLSELPDAIDLIAVIPWRSAFGGGTESILRAGERLHRVLPLDTQGPDAAHANAFFTDVLRSRLQNIQLPDGLRPLLQRAAVFSGGIPRVFLQLIADAGTYARAKRGAAWPDSTDLEDALTDQRDSFRRVLLPGDTDAIIKVIGTDGRELEVDRRVRLLAQGILLERVHSGHIVLEPHPLIEHAVRHPRP